ncbi:MAG: phosphoribosylformylglycinamidine synthase subunit PurQ [Myxococcota bacterium]
MKVKALVITGNGTNCEKESRHALEKAGADLVVDSNIWELLAGDYQIDDYNFILLPGGFLDGDHLGSAQAAAHRFKYGKTGELLKQLLRVIEHDGVIMGICNGFQLLVKLGLLPWPNGKRTVTLSHNQNGRFEDRWVNLAVNPDSPCIFTRNMDRLELPVRHGEGRIVHVNQEIETEIRNNNLVPLAYCHPESCNPTMEYPFNPNGSPHGTASLCDPTGKIFGLMPHPEAFTHKTNHPHWTRKKLPETGAGLKFFANGINFIRNQG